MRRVIGVLLLPIAMSACASPEARRQRGGGSGADVGNRPSQVKMHEGSRQYWKTPVRQEFKTPPLDSAEQARRLSVSKSTTSQPPATSSGGTDR